MAAKLLQMFQSCTRMFDRNRKDRSKVGERTDLANSCKSCLCPTCRAPGGGGNLVKNESKYPSEVRNDRDSNCHNNGKETHGNSLQTVFCKCQEIDNSSLISETEYSLNVCPCENFVNREHILCTKKVTKKVNPRKQNIPSTRRDDKCCQEITITRKKRRKSLRNCKVRPYDECAEKCVESAKRDFAVDDLTRSSNSSHRSDKKQKTSLKQQSHDKCIPSDKLTSRSTKRDTSETNFRSSSESELRELIELSGDFQDEKEEVEVQYTPFEVCNKGNECSSVDPSEHDGNISQTRGISVKLAQEHNTMECNTNQQACCMPLENGQIALYTGGRRKSAKVHHHPTGKPLYHLQKTEELNLESSEHCDANHVSNSEGFMQNGSMTRIRRSLSDSYLLNLQRNAENTGRYGNWNFAGDQVNFNCENGQFGDFCPPNFTTQFIVSSDDNFQIFDPSFANIPNGNQEMYFMIVPPSTMHADGMNGYPDPYNAMWTEESTLYYPDFTDCDMYDQNYHPFRRKPTPYPKIIEINDDEDMDEIIKQSDSPYVPDSPLHQSEAFMDNTNTMGAVPHVSESVEGDKSTREIVDCPEIVHCNSETPGAGAETPEVNRALEGLDDDIVQFIRENLYLFANYMQ